MLRIVGFDARVVPNPLIVFDELGCDAIGQVGRHMIEGSRLKVSYPYENLEIRYCQAIGSEVPPSIRFKPLL